MLGGHENNYYRLYDNDYFYTEIRNGLNALVSLNVDNFLDALRELRNFCSRTHRPTSAPLCGPCEITKNYLDEVNNDVYAFPFYFYYDECFLQIFSPFEIRISNDGVFLFIFLFSLFFSCWMSTNAGITSCTATIAFTLKSGMD